MAVLLAAAPLAFAEGEIGTELVYNRDTVAWPFAARPAEAAVESTAAGSAGPSNPVLSPVPPPVLSPAPPPAPPAVTPLQILQSQALPAVAVKLPAVKAQLSPQAERPSLWQRIRNGFAMPDIEGERVRRWEQYYASRPDYVQRMTTRGSRYLHHVVEEVEKRGMPLELALLPFAESAFNPQAMSSAKASGMWQFMPATGREYSLRQNMFRDDRRDVLASTNAALDYLQRLHRMVGGDWHLALAAYNWGVGNVQRAVANNKRAGKDARYENLAMPDETRNYLPKLQAIKNMVLAPGNLGMVLPPLEDESYFRRVPIEQDIDVARAAEMAGLPLDEFHALNPQLNKPVILAAGTPHVLLPHENADLFAGALATATGPLATWTAWTAPRTLRASEAARKVGMSEALLRQINQIPARMMVRAGSTLLVPRGARVQDDVTPRIADQATMALTPEPRPLRRVTVKAGKSETVASLARRHRVPASAVASWNKVAIAARFKPGQMVVLMLPALEGNSSTRRPAARSKRAAHIKAGRR